MIRRIPFIVLFSHEFLSSVIARSSVHSLETSKTSVTEANPYSKRFENTSTAKSTFSQNTDLEQAVKELSDQLHFVKTALAERKRTDAERMVKEKIQKAEERRSSFTSSTVQSLTSEASSMGTVSSGVCASSSRPSTSIGSSRASSIFAKRRHSKGASPTFDSTGFQAVSCAGRADMKDHTGDEKKLPITRQTTGNHSRDAEIFPTEEKSATSKFSPRNSATFTSSLPFGHRHAVEDAESRHVTNRQINRGQK